jgi:hypothetical protein
MGVGNLREFVNWANGLDREAVELAEGTIDNLEAADQREAVARRIAHLSGRVALGHVKSADRRQIHLMGYRRRVARLRSEKSTGLFQLEAKDLGL